MKIVAFIVLLVSAWLAWGAGSLHEKDPINHTTTPMWILGAVALASLVALFTSKSTAKSRG
ncbi:hypothetical protein [Amycolatopsis minnesotensis]|uniref:MYXO-CTERM domain-containing protein n=1 Tax=Amycolatopsis minnesotensis TaxID=337894 RepID=A0ABN2SGR3_9PSEU